MISSTDLQPLEWMRSTRRWAGLAAWPTALAAWMSLITFAGLSLLYRNLPVSEAGILAVLLSLSDLLSLFALIGLATTITRLYAAAEPGTFDWPTDLGRTAIAAAPIVVAGTATLAGLYGFHLWQALFLGAATMIGTLLAASHAMLNSQRRHAWSAFLARLPNASFLALALFHLLTGSRLRLTTALWVYLVASAVALTIGLLLLRRHLSRGSRTISWRQRIEGFGFMATSAANLLPEQGLTAVAAQILPLEAVAGFAAVSVLMRPFRLLRRVLATVLAPDLVRHPRRSYRKLIAAASLLALGTGAAAVFLGPPVASAFYGDRYGEAIGWIPLLSVAGALLVAALPPRADLAVRAPMSIVNRFAAGYVLSMTLMLGLGVAAMNVWGAIFLPVSVVLLQAAEIGVAYSFWWSFRGGEGSD